MCEDRWLFPPQYDAELEGPILYRSQAERDAHARWLKRPLDERKAIFAARVGLMRGDLTQLEALIRAGYAIDTALAAALADAIQGSNADGFRLEMRLAKGAKSPRKRAEKDHRDWLIRCRVEDLRFAARCAGEAGVSDAIFAQVADEFKVSITTAQSAWRRFGIKGVHS